MRAPAFAISRKREPNGDAFSDEATRRVIPRGLVDGQPVRRHIDRDIGGMLAARQARRFRGHISAASGEGKRHDESREGEGNGGVRQ